MLVVKYIVGDDWDGLYVHNVLVDEGHKIDFKEGFEIICRHIDEIESVDSIHFSTYSVNQDWLEEQGSLPEKFEDIPSEMLEEWCY